MNTNVQPEMDGDADDVAPCSSPDSLASCARNSIAKVEEFVQRDPKTAMLISVGAGLGLGVLVGAVLANSTPRRSRRGIDRQSAEQLGHRFMEAVSNAVPASVSQYFGDR